MGGGSSLTQLFSLYENRFEALIAPETALGFALPLARKSTELHSVPSCRSGAATPKLSSVQPGQPPSCLPEVKPARFSHSGFR